MLDNTNMTENWLGARQLDESRVAVIVPTLNGGRIWHDWLAAFSRQTCKPSRVLIVDSSSDDGTAQAARSCGMEVRKIERADFDHGGTRNRAIEWAGDADLLVFLTQDAVLADPYSLNHLIAVFDDPSIAVAYGRQLPRKQAGLIEAHARWFNYPPQSEVRDFSSVSRRGVKAAFCSNSFAAYRREVLLSMGGFPERVIVNEDMCVVARMLTKGWRVAYCAEATVIHSHGHDLLQEFRRYFDVGVFLAHQPWLIEQFGTGNKPAFHFVRSELNFLLRKKPVLIPLALLRTVLKLAGHKLGLHAVKIPLMLKRGLSSQKQYWR
jgi:rhamnosyltransferase